MNKEKYIIQKMGEFPTLPTVYSKLLEVMADPNSSVNDVASVISYDMAATVKILKTVNSTMYGLNKKIDSLSDAILQIGYKEIKNLVIALSVIDMFSDLKSTSHFNLVDFWKHSIATGIISRYIAIKAGVKKIENFFLAGLLHDIGKIVLFKAINKEYIETLRMASLQDKFLVEAENEILGTNHCKIGEYITRNWNLPESISRSIFYHEKGESDIPNDKITYCIHLSNIIAGILDFGKSGNTHIRRPNPVIWNTCDFEDNFFVDSLEYIIDEYNESVKILNIN